ncbi:alpha/beta hydrolase [Methylomonas sp. SURF-2]|uniref:Alpha/beta hydrolase n=1 Tax=Methylomonas subterranea TaxID=2952225 RepID=A0ABT1TK67_9GAMM|nr:alpha/beta hydrolase [Methylomonas sp. SURF-2]MCQ8105633.1 alpha/beta hydrolase [Methylomonas sp. SURF-2]
MQKLVIYNHGKDSIPWGEKPLALAEVARRRGYLFLSPDYRDSNDPDARVAKLLSLQISAYETLVLAGSSMGAYVATVAAERLGPAGLFLIAPAFYLPGYALSDFRPGSAEIEVFHGWADEVVPPENAWRFCRAQRATLHMLDGDHRLLSGLPQMTAAFEAFLSRCDQRDSQGDADERL